MKIEQKRNCQNYVYGSAFGFNIQMQMCNFGGRFGRHFDEKCTFVSKMDRFGVHVLLLLCC